MTDICPYEVDAILEARQSKSRPVYDELTAWARVHKPHEPPSSVEYLADVLPRLARRVRLADIPAMMPSAWKRLRSAP